MVLSNVEQKNSSQAKAIKPKKPKPKAKILGTYKFIAKKLSYLHIGMVQVAIKSLTRKGINASVLMYLRDARFKNFKDSILGMITASLYDGPVYFNC